MKQFRRLLAVLLLFVASSFIKAEADEENDHVQAIMDEVLPTQPEATPQSAQLVMEDRAFVEMANQRSPFYEDQVAEEAVNWNTPMIQKTVEENSREVSKNSGRYKKVEEKPEPVISDPLDAETAADYVKNALKMQKHYAHDERDRDFVPSHTFYEYTTVKNDSARDKQVKGRPSPPPSHPPSHRPSPPPSPPPSPAPRRTPTTKRYIPDWKQEEKNVVKVDSRKTSTTKKSFYGWEQPKSNPKPLFSEWESSEEQPSKVLPNKYWETPSTTRSPPLRKPVPEWEMTDDVPTTRRPPLTKYLPEWEFPLPSSTTTTTTTKRPRMRMRTTTKPTIKSTTRPTPKIPTESPDSVPVEYTYLSPQEAAEQLNQPYLKKSPTVNISPSSTSTNYYYPITEEMIEEVIVEEEQVTSPPSNLPNYPYWFLESQSQMNEVWNKNKTSYQAPRTTSTTTTTSTPIPLTNPAHIMQLTHNGFQPTRGEQNIKASVAIKSLGERSINDHRNSIRSHKARSKPMKTHYYIRPASYLDPYTSSSSQDSKYITPPSSVNLALQNFNSNFELNDYEKMTIPVYLKNQTFNSSHIATPKTSYELEGDPVSEEEEDIERDRQSLHITPDRFIGPSANPPHERPPFNRDLETADSSKYLVLWDIDDDHPKKRPKKNPTPPTQPPLPPAPVYNQQIHYHHADSFGNGKGGEMGLLDEDDGPDVTHTHHEYTHYDNEEPINHFHVSGPMKDHYDMPKQNFNTLFDNRGSSTNQFDTYRRPPPFRPTERPSYRPTERPYYHYEAERQTAGHYDAETMPSNMRKNVLKVMDSNPNGPDNFRTITKDDYARHVEAAVMRYLGQMKDIGVRAGGSSYTKGIGGFLQDDEVDLGTFNFAKKSVGIPVGPRPPPLPSSKPYPFRPGSPHQQHPLVASTPSSFRSNHKNNNYKILSTMPKLPKNVYTAGGKMNNAILTMQDGLNYNVDLTMKNYKPQSEIPLDVGQLYQHPSTSFDHSSVLKNVQSFDNSHAIKAGQAKDMWAEQSKHNPRIPVKGGTDISDSPIQIINGIPIQNPYNIPYNELRYMLGGFKNGQPSSAFNDDPLKTIHSIPNMATMNQMTQSGAPSSNAYAIQPPPQNALSPWNSWMAPPTTPASQLYLRAVRRVPKNKAPAVASSKSMISPDTKLRPPAKG